MSFLRKFLINFLNLSVDSSGTAIITALIGVLAVGFLGVFLGQLITGGEFLIEILVVIIVLCSVAYLIFRFNHFEGDLIVKLDEKQSLKPKSIIITGLSPYKKFGDNASNLDVVINLIKENKAKEVYFISVLKQDDESGTIFALQHDLHESRQGVLEAWTTLKKREDMSDVNFFFEPIINEDSSQQTYEATINVLKSLENDNRLDEVAIDVTAGRKAMSIGLSIAAIEYGVALTYLATPRLKNGEPDYNAEASVITTLNAKYLNSMLLNNLKDRSDNE